MTRLGAILARKRVALSPGAYSAGLWRLSSRLSMTEEVAERIERILTIGFHSKFDGRFRIRRISSQPMRPVVDPGQKTLQLKRCPSEL